MNKTVQDTATPFTSRTRLMRADPLQREPALPPRPQVRQPEFAAIEVRESRTAFHIVAPLSGIDARNFYVIATPHSILIEIRLNRVKRHQMMDSSIIERIDQRIEREVALPAEIEKGKTTIRIAPDSLVITAPKAQQGQDGTWSQLILF
ncbi:MAG TPA: Hsp20/alpha crystallin family protein [Bryobacteraceae bacterium]|nr:Hsp20/alpha crystallin family protein [Bryobacteraceae bacterium]